MEAQNKQKKSILGTWWEPIRKWFYPSWLVYETSIRFYDYTQSVHNYIEKQHDYIASNIGEIGFLMLDVLCSISTFVICTAFLTIPACFLLYTFFKEDNLTGSKLEEKMKPFF